MQWRDLIAASRLLASMPDSDPVPGFPEKGSKHGIIRRVPHLGKQQL